MSKTVLVTGGAGFLGSHLCEKLLHGGHSVICLDNLMTGKIENIQDSMRHPRFRFLEHDICKPIFLEVDEIYNLACPASPKHYQKDPVQTLKVNILGAMNMLDLSKECGAKIFQASTSEVYGDPLCHPQKEEYWGNVNPNGIRACYDEGKRCAEALFFDYHRQYDIPIKVARIFNTYGPRMSIDDGRVVSTFITQAITKEPLTVYGKGKQTRSFCYVDDLIDAIVAFMGSDEKITGPVNLGNPEEYSIAELAEKIRELASSNSSIFYTDLPKDDPRQRKPDISLAKKYLSWQPTTGIEEGLVKTINYFQNRHFSS